MNANILKAAVLAAALAAAGSATAQGGPGYGYGPGMMGGGGPMMGGYGPGYGGGVAALNLSDEQREKIFALQEESRRKNWDTMGQMRSEMFKLRSLYNSDDSKAILDQQRKVDDLRRQMLASRLESRKQVEQILNPEQRRQLRGFGPWWMHGDLE